MAPVNSYGGFLFDDGMGMSGKFSRGTRTKIYDIAQRNIVSSPVIHMRGERRTAARDVAKIIEFTGHIWGNPGLTEADRDRNVDQLLQSFLNGTQQLCVHDDGRYYNAILYQFESNVNEEDPMHCEYLARFYAGDPYAWAANPVTNTVFTNRTMTSAGANLYQLTWTTGAASQLGSVPSHYVLSGTVVTSNGCFELKLYVGNTTPIPGNAIVNAGPVANGTTFLFNCMTQTAQFGGTNTSFPVQHLTLDPTDNPPITVTLFARAQTSAPVVTVTESWTARYY